LTTARQPLLPCTTDADVVVHRREEPAMAWDFSTDAEYQEKLDWAREFVRTKVMPLDYVFPKEQFTRPMSDELKAIVDPLKQAVKDQGLWATQLGPDLGGQGTGS
jgi:acyl-CoA dehydrogenase